MIVLLAALAGVVLLVVAVRLEEHRRPEVLVLAILGVTVLDAILFPQQADVPVGLFRPAVGGQDVRPADVLIVVALAARLLVRGLPRRVSTEGLVWTAFVSWYAFAGVVGLIREQPTDLLLFEGRFALETGGMIALVAGVPLGRLAATTVIDWLGKVGGAVAVVIVTMAAAGVSIEVPVPSGAQLGAIKPDAATILFTLGLIVLVSAACREEPPGWVMLGGAAMAAAPVVADQRAALVGMAPAVLIVAVAVGGPTWRRRSRVPLAALVPVVAVLLVPLGVTVLRAGTSGESIGALPLVARLSETFGSTQKQQSADIRLNLLREGVELIGDRPLVGHGLGQPVQIAEDPRKGFLSIGDFHNIVIDLGVRCGLTGVALFVLACVVSGVAARRRWSQLASDAHAALVLAAAAALGGLLLKGMFETIFQKYRLAVVLGLLIGIVAAGDTAAKRRSASVAGAGSPATNATIPQ